MDPDAGWLTDSNDDQTSSGNNDSVAVQGSAGGATAFPNIPTGPPVPNPYAHVLDIPCTQRQFTHWGRPVFLRYKLLMDYHKNYYEDYIDFMNKRQKGIVRDVPRAQEWGERICKVYTRDGKKLSASDYKYWLTDKNVIKPKCSIFHAVHSKGYYNRQYYSILF